MPAGKIFAISFAINAMMGGSFNTAMSQAASAMRQLDEKTKELNAEQKRLNNAWNQSQAAVRDYQGKSVPRASGGDPSYFNFFF